MGFLLRSSCISALLLLLHVLPAQAETCGDGLISSSEECDDGNVNDGDGCSAACTVEPNYTCVPGFFATGVDALGMRVDLATDIHWSWSRTLDRSTATAGWVQRHPAWTVVAGAQWTTPGPNFGDDLSDPTQIYTYWFQDVVVPDGAAGTFGMTLTMGADNGAQLFVNNVPVGAEVVGFGAGNITTVTIPASLFIAGVNTLMIQLREEGPGSPRGLLVSPSANTALSNCVRHCASDAECDDGNECTLDRCQIGGGCGNTPKPSGSACSMGVCDGTALAVCEPACGDGIVAGFEACDDGNTSASDGCSPVCTVEPGYTCAGSPSACLATCGDGIVTGAEACDDGNATAGDGCSLCMPEPGYTCIGDPSSCLTTCGDGIVAGLETCDDGNTSAGDGCSELCLQESGYTCTGAPSACMTTCGDDIVAGIEACDDGNTIAGDGCSDLCVQEPGYTCTGNPSICGTTCGDGIATGAEACDDGNITTGDGCSTLCTVEPGYTCAGTPSICGTTCGDGIATGAEACDDGNTTAGDGCSTLCTVEPGYMCTGILSICGTTCGDGIAAGAEACDDGNTTAGDGCSTLCTLEPGYTCAGTPSVCGTTCGDGIVTASEECDDGNTTAGDGCSPLCKPEPGYTCTGILSICGTTCGDGIATGAEACDDGNTTAGDGCSTLCTLEPGYTCAGTPSICGTTCGDGIVTASEECDDGNTTAGDGCSPLCKPEPGYTCAGTPSICGTTCGDGVLNASEHCDDGNLVAGDGCSPTCAIEDRDSDGVLDPDDNCPAVANPDQSDLDGDGLGDACDATPGFYDVRVQGGGCNAGGNNGGLLALLLAMLLLSGRRKSKRLVIAVLAIAPSIAFAQEATRVDLERLAITPDRSGLIGVESGEVLKRGDFDLGLFAGYENDPLVVTGDGTRVGSLVHNRIGGSLFGAFGLGAHLQLGIAIPLVLEQSRDANQPGLSPGTVPALSSFGIGDIVVMPKLQIVRGVAILVGIDVPTGRDEYRGTKQVAIAPELDLSARHGRLRLALDLGYRTREHQAFLGQTVDDEFTARAGIGARVVRNGELALTLDGATSASDPFDRKNVDALEARAQYAHTIASAWVVFAGGGVGLANGYGTPDFRLFSGVRFGHTATRPPAKRIAVVVPPPTPVETIDPDRDQDGIVDRLDQCPDQPEDKDGFQDEDGCPDPDNDNDGVLDVADKCPLVPAPGESDGCPPPDRDNDTVIDRVDNCPDEPGTVANHGCKDVQKVAITATGIDILEVVYFETNKAVLQKRSTALLTQVEQVLAAHPELKHVTVEGHTDDRGNDAANKTLSQRRAQAVVDFLTHAGIDAGRLTAIGYGEERPIADNKTAKGRATNRRVEFKTTP